MVSSAHPIVAILNDTPTALKQTSTIARMPARVKESMETLNDGQTKIVRVAKFAFDERVA
jgi:hypothetical protein